MFSSNADNKWKIDEAGKYDVKLNTADMTISIVKNVPSNISSVEAEANAPLWSTSLLMVSVSTTFLPRDFISSAKVVRL